MTGIIKKRGQSYQRTIVELMMYNPMIFPTREAAEDYIFLCCGTGFAWNTEGQLTKEFSNKRGKIERTLSSLVGEKGDPNRERFDNEERCCIYDVSGVPLWISDVCEYSPITYVLEDKVTPAADWEEALDSLCFKILKYDVSTYKKYLSSYFKLTYPGASLERSWSNHLKLRTSATKLQNKFRERERIKRIEENRNLKENLDKFLELKRRKARD